MSSIKEIRELVDVKLDKLDARPTHFKQPWRAARTRSTSECAAS